MKTAVDFKKQKRTAETVLLSLFETVFFGLYNICSG
ncbi:Uncharacterised protein [Streptococcus pneumoniae]|nr:Uncharacterised protein [Streptococcus pneumoniae]